MGRKKALRQDNNIWGYDLNTVAEKAARICGIYSAELFRKGRQKPHVDETELFCYRTSRNLKFPLTDLARELEMAIAGFGYAAQRGEAIDLRHSFHLRD